jgi:hypothetical protein
MTVDAQDVLRMTEIAVKTLKTIQALTQVVPDKAQDALLTINAIIRTLQDGLDGKTTPDIVEAELNALTSSVDDQFDHNSP